MPSTSPSIIRTPTLSSMKLTSTKFCDVPTVSIFVGNKKKLFHIHKDRLCEASSFFKAAFEGKFRESSEMTMDLPEEDEELFDLFVQWVYFQRYEIPAEEAEARAQRYLEPVKLYVLADKYDAGDVRSVVITKLFAMAKREEGIAPGTVTVAYAYDHVSPNSTLCRLLADWYACKVRLDWFSLEAGQKWLQEHPQVACALVSSLAMTASQTTKMNPFSGEMPEKYKENIQKPQQ